MHLLLIVGILLAYGPTLAMSEVSSAMEQSLKSTRDELAAKMRIEAKDLKRTDSLKVPEIECGRDYFKEAKQFGTELTEKYPEDKRKQWEQMEKDGEETFATCALLSRTEVNCKSKLCEGDMKPTVLCICGPKKCKLDSNGLCEKKGGSSSFFVFGIIINLTIFYLIASFF